MTRMTRQNAKPSSEPSFFDQSPPVALESEEGILSAILNDPDLLDEFVGDLRPDHFFDIANRSIFDAVRHVHLTAQTVDSRLLIEEIQRRGLLASGPEAVRLYKILRDKPSPLAARRYIRQVKETADLRAFSLRCVEAIRNAYERRDDCRTLIRELESQLAEILESGKPPALFTASEAMYEAIEAVRARRDGEVVRNCIQTGFEGFDDLVGGLHESNLVILAARPSQGKTSWALNVSANIAFNGGVVLFVSLEMSRIEVGSRLVSSESRINGHRLNHGSVSPDDLQRMAAAYDRVAPKDGLVFDETPNRSILDIRATARRLKRERKRLDLLVVDYLGLIAPDDPKIPRQEQVARMSRQLKDLARELSAPVLCLAQLNRQAESGRDGNRPRLSHLRESGAIEQDADMVLFVHREEQYLPPGEKRDAVAGQAELIVAKNRNGPTGDVELTWRKEITRFEDRAPARFGEFDEWNREEEDGPVAYDEF